MFGRIEVFAIFVLSASAHGFPGKAAKCCDEYCYAEEKLHPQNAHFASLTSYKFVRGTNLHEIVSLPNCTAKKLWTIVRHGTRMPRPSTVHQLMALEAVRDKIVENLEMSHRPPREGGLCTSDLELFKKWKFNENISDEKSDTLTPEGFEELRLIGESYMKAFPKLFKGYYEPDEYQFRNTNSSRTIDSFAGYVEGIFGKFANEYVLSSVDEMLLRPYEHCPAHYNNSKAIRDKSSEPWRFLIDHTDIIEEVSRRLGFEHSLSITQIEHMHSLCSYETAYNSDVPSAWCAAFTTRHIELFEYHWDLLDYIGSGFRNPINKRIMGPTIVDMIQNLESEDGPAVTASFGHSYSIKVFLTSMGIGENAIPLRADNFDQMANRTFRTSSLTPFASNLAAVKYECIGDDDVDDDKVLFFLNEKPAHFDWCKSGVCRMSELKKRYNNFIEEDSKKWFNEVCYSAAVSFRKMTLLSLITIAGLIKFVS